MSNVKEDFLYTEDHEWVKLEGENAKIGITDFAQASLGDIVFVELPDIDKELENGESFGVVESIKSVSDLYSPINGKVLEKNEELEAAPEQINQDAYAAWMIKVKLTDSNQIDGLMNAGQYQEYCNKNS